MEKRNQIISGRIVDHFLCGDYYLPEWEDISFQMRAENLNVFSGFENMPESLIYFIFKSNDKIVKKIPDFTKKHYYLINNLFKDYYKLEVCSECGTTWRKLDISEASGNELNYDTVDHDDWTFDHLKKKNKKKHC